MTTTETPPPTVEVVDSNAGTSLTLMVPTSSCDKGKLVLQQGGCCSYDALSGFMKRFVLIYILFFFFFGKSGKLQLSLNHRQTQTTLQFFIYKFLDMPYRWKEWRVVCGEESTFIWCDVLALELR